MSIDGESDANPAFVRGLPVPPLLRHLLDTGRWQHPGDAVMRAVLPWFEDPLNFLTSTRHMEDASRSLDLFAVDELSAQYFHAVPGSRAAHPVLLPYLDIEQAFFIAVNREPGDDVAIALDYRADPVDPRVVAGDWWTDPSKHHWRVIAPTFSAFAATLGLLDP